MVLILRKCLRSLYHKEQLDLLVRQVQLDPLDPLGQLVLLGQLDLLVLQVLLGQLAQLALLRDSVRLLLVQVR